ncbi:MAG: 8-oxo-dGTP diphosphatase [Candidatus Aenigmarchaeota archaeon]|nr:8-oxo-dGTP diphosphatase [Candidatus Aenigmarchaeota archaeon]
METTLCYVIKDGKILLIHKKRGFGAGKVNAPGGRIEEGESPEQCAVRELREEIGVTPAGIRKVGINRFFNGKERLMVHIFTASGFDGELKETDEAEPFWESIDSIPFDRMWDDDVHWFPYMLEGRTFAGNFTFSEDWKEIIEYKIEETGQWSTGMTNGK